MFLIALFEVNLPKGTVGLIIALEIKEKMGDEPDKNSQKVQISIAEIKKGKGKRKARVISDGNDAYCQKYQEVSLKIK